MSGLGRELARSLEGTDVVPRLVSDREWRLGVLTVVVGAKHADLRYARESVGRSEPQAAAIVLAMQRALARLEQRSSPPDALLPRLVDAYASVLATAKVRDGERVPLVDVRDALATTRAQFAWDLARLQREHRLVVGERRIDLGIATGNAAAQRSRVVWIENERGGGAYYQTFRLIPQEAHRDEARTPKTARGAHRRSGAANPRADGRER